MEATLTCKKATTSYNYLFVDDKLSKTINDVMESKIKAKNKRK